MDYDFKFPAERKALEKEFANLQLLSAAEQEKDWFQAFAKITLSQHLEQTDWVNLRAQFVEQLSAHLWATHQLDAFRKAVTDYTNRLHAAVPQDPPPVPRLGIAVIGQGVSNYNEPVISEVAGTWGLLPPHQARGRA
jgi:hypothetical protein